jgi:predicted nucleic acid-binding protein
MPRFLDTNILLRYLTKDDETKASACFELLRRVERGEEVVVTSDLVIAEVVFNLQSPRQYGVSRDDIRRLVEPIIGLRGLRLPRKALFARAFDLYCDSRVDFADAYNVAYMESRRVNEVYSYDTDFDRIEGISRFEPSAAP